MGEHHDIILRQADDGPNPPDLLHQILDDVKELFPTATEAAGNILKGKGQQEVLKAQEIKAKIIERVGQLEIERQRLIQQREEAERNAQLQQQRDRNAHDERLMELEIQRHKEKTESLAKIIECIKSLQELGVEVDMEVVTKALSDLITVAIPPSELDIS